MKAFIKNSRWSKEAEASAMLLIASAIWGGGFVAQRAAAVVMGPFTFNALRFGLGAAVMIVFLRIRGQLRSPLLWNRRSGILVGLLLFAGATCQQIGVTTTIAGKAGLITGFYLLMTPLLLFLCWGRRTSLQVWFGATVAMLGLYFMSSPDALSYSYSSGDLWLVACAVAFSFHLIFIEMYVAIDSPIELAAMQNAVCSLASFGLACWFEPRDWSYVPQVLGPLCYSGFMSIGLAYTLQLLGQQRVSSAVAALLMSAESLFAVLLGWIILGEVMTTRELGGASLVFVGIVLPQFWSDSRDQLSKREAAGPVGL